LEYRESPERELGEESSVVTEIVEEKVVELEDSQDLPSYPIDYSNDREQRIREYLNVDQDEYLNRNEYEDVAGEEGAEEWVPRSNDAKCNRYTDEVRKQENTPGNTKYVRNKYMDSNPIQETVKEEMSATPKYRRDNEDNLERKLAKIIFPNHNDKLHLVWERERLQRKREEYERKNDPMTMHEYMKDLEPGFSTKTTRGKLAEYDFLRPSKRPQRFVTSLKSGIPLLADHYKFSKTHSTAALSNVESFQKMYSQF
jgi:hypothetical protein